MGTQNSTTALGVAVHALRPEGATSTGLVPTVDVGFRLGERAVIHPVVGLCSWDGPDELTAGAGLGVKFITADTWSLGAQSHLAWSTGRSELSVMTIPVLLAATFDVGESASLHVAGGARVTRFAVEAFNQTHLTKNYDPVASAGITLPIGSARISAGLVVVRSGEGDVAVVGGGEGGEDGYYTDFSFGGGIQLPLGG
jgi:hypothetical protein